MRRALVASVFVACGPVNRSSAPPPTAPPAVTSAAMAYAAAPPAPSGPPPTRTVDQVDRLFGVDVHDPYRWMETEPAELEAWFRAQDAYARAYLARIPGRDALRARMLELGDNTDAIEHVATVGERTFYLRTPVGAAVARLVVRDGAGERVLVDPATLGDADHRSVISAFAPSPDGTLVAYNVAGGGDEVASIHVVEVATGTARPDTIARTWGTDPVLWLDGERFVYSQMPPPTPGHDPMQDWRLRLHRLGADPAGDVDVLGPTGRFPVAPTEFGGLDAVVGERWVLAMAGGAHPERRFAVARRTALDTRGGLTTSWTQVADYADGVSVAQLHGERLYLLSHRDAPNGRVLSVPLARPDLAHARIEVAEDPATPIVAIAAARDALYVQRLAGDGSKLLRKPWRGAAQPVTLPFAGAITQLITDPRRDGLWFGLEGWTQPVQYLAYQPGRGAVTPTGIGATAIGDYSQVVVTDVEAPSADGTMVPLTIIRRADAALDGRRPTIVYAYGAYGEPTMPWFSLGRLAWLERGGVFTVCHVRGGGERGEAWHQAGMRGTKMNSIHDLEACALYLQASGYTRPGATFAHGYSQGGLLIGRALTDRPELWGATNPMVGVQDPVRILDSNNGANEVPEMGDPRTEEGFRGLLAMSPYASVTAAAYPATLLTTGVHDSRVPPWMTAKLTARLQASSTSDRPILLRVEFDAGHGVDSTRAQLLAERADEYAFFLAAAGEPGFAVAP